MNIRKGQMVSLGHGKFVRSDHIVGLEPIQEGRGSGSRTRVYVAGLEDPLIASRTESTILRDLITDQVTEREERLAKMLHRILDSIERINSTVRAIVHDQGGWDLTRAELEIQAALDQSQSKGSSALKQAGLF